MDLTALVKLFPALAVLLPIIMLWGTIKTILHRIFNLFVIEIDAKLDAVRAISYFIKKKAKKINGGFYAYRGHSFYLKSLQKRGVVGMKSIRDQSGLYFFGWKPFLVVSSAGKDKQSEMFYEERIKVYTFRGLVKPDAFIKESLAFYNEGTSELYSRFFVKIIAGIGNKNIIKSDNFQPKAQEAEDFFHEEIVNVDFSDIGYNTSKEDIPYIFHKDTEEIYEDVLKWKKSRDWYRKKGILWRRGSLLYGVPGSGKTSTIRAIAQKLDLPVFVFDLASLSNSEFISEWKELQVSIPAIVVFEDVDSVFDKRTNIIGAMGGGLSFDCLLNAIGGTLPSEGIYTFVTTNHIEKLDQALGIPDSNGQSTRPGRLDAIYKIDYVNGECREKIAAKILGADHPKFSEFVNSTEQLTAAQLVEKCTKIALNEYWKNQN